MYNIIKELHSGFRYIVFLLLLIAIIRAFMGLMSKAGYSEGNRKLNLFAMISMHAQLLIGIVLYFMSPLVSFTSAAMKQDTLRYFTVEHWVGMVIAIALITIGHSRSKKAITAGAKHKQIAIFYTLGVLVVIGVLVAGHIPVFGPNH